MVSGGQGLIFGLVVCLFLPYVLASHFRGGQVTVEQTGNGREILVTGEWMYAHSADCGEVEYTYSLDTNCNDELKDDTANVPCSLDQLPDGAHRYTMSWLVDLDADASCGDGGYLFELSGPGGRWNAAKNANSQQWEAIPSELTIVSGMTHSTPFPLVPKDLKMPVTENFGDEYRYVVPLFSADDEPIVACTFETDPDYMDFSLTYLPFEETPFTGAPTQTQPRLEIADGTCVIVWDTSPGTKPGSLFFDIDNDEYAFVLRFRMIDASGDFVVVDVSATFYPGFPLTCDPNPFAMVSECCGTGRGTVCNAATATIETTDRRDARPTLPPLATESFGAYPINVRVIEARNSAGGAVTYSFSPASGTTTGPFVGTRQQNVDAQPPNGSPVGQQVATGVLELADNYFLAYCTYTLSTVPAMALSVAAAGQQYPCQTDMTCINVNDGMIATTVVTPSCGGTPTYSWTSDNGVVVPPVPNPTGLPPGTYFVTVTLSTNTAVSNSVTLAYPAEFSAQAERVQQCGSMRALTENGCSPFTYSWEDPNGSPVGTTATISGQTLPGTYSLEVYDQNNCLATSSVELRSVELQSFSTIDFFDFDSYSGSWAISGGGNTASSTSGRAQILSGAFQVRDTQLSFTLTTPSFATGSVGFFLGLLISDGDIVSPEYFLVDWRGDATNGPAGLFISRVTALNPTDDELLQHSGPVEEIAASSTFDSAWDPSTTYNFQVRYTADAISVTINGASAIVFVQDPSNPPHPTHSFGIYANGAPGTSFSQASVDGFLGHACGTTEAFANFEDHLACSASAVSATIDWGDGSNTAATISSFASGVGGTASGSHSYAATGTYTVTFFVSSAGFSSTLSYTALVVPPGEVLNSVNAEQFMYVPFLVTWVATDTNFVSDVTIDLYRASDQVFIANVATNVPVEVGQVEFVAFGILPISYYFTINAAGCDFGNSPLPFILNTIPGYPNAVPSS